MFFIIGKSEETTFEFSQRFASITKNGNRKDHEKSKFATKNGML